MFNQQETEKWLQAAVQLRHYVTANDTTKYNNVPSNIIIIDLTHSNLVQKHIEIRFNRHDTLDDLRHKIYQKTGTPHNYQHLQVYATSISNGGGREQIIHEISPTTSPTIKLGYYSLRHGMRIHCIDLNPNSISSHGKLENVALVPKFQLSDEEYNKRTKTLRSWSKQQKEINPNFTLAKHGQEHKELQEAKRLYKLGLSLPKGYHVVTDEQDGTQIVEKNPNFEDTEEQSLNIGKDSVQGIEINMRCEVQPGGRRGTVQYVGEVPELKGGGYWVGIVFDEPVGKNNGIVNGKKYFTAEAKFGGFCRGKNLMVGDYPERDIFDELDDEDDDSEDEL